MSMYFLHFFIFFIIEFDTLSAIYRRHVLEYQNLKIKSTNILIIFVFSSNNKNVNDISLFLMFYLLILFKKK